MKRTNLLATAILAAGLAVGCSDDHDATAQVGSARGETMQATGTPGVGAENSTGTTPTGTTTGTTVAGPATTGGGAPTAPQITTAPPTAASDTARAEIHAKDPATPAIAAAPATPEVAPVGGPAAVDQTKTSVADTAQLAAAEDKAKDTEDKDAHHHADAVAHVKPAAGAPKDMQVSGVVKFMKAEHGVKLMVDLKGLAPNSKHGFHIHEKDDLSGPDLKTAGPHFNPGGKKHGGAEGDERHGGDLGNLTADDKGNAKVEIMAHGITIDGEKDGIIGRSILVHAKPDDMKTDPSGDSGDRIAGGAIHKPKMDKDKDKEKEKSADAGAAAGAETQVTDKPAGAAQELNK